MSCAYDSVITRSLLHRVPFYQSRALPDSRAGAFLHMSHQQRLPDNRRLWKVAPLRTAARDNPMEEENEKNQIRNQTNFPSPPLRYSQNTDWVPSHNMWEMMTESLSGFGIVSPHFPLLLDFCASRFSAASLSTTHCCLKVLDGVRDLRKPLFVKNMFCKLYSFLKTQTTIITLIFFIPVLTPLKSNSFIFGDILNQNKQLIYLISDENIIFGKKLEYHKQHQSKLTVQSTALYQYLLSWFTCCCCSSQKQCRVHAINLMPFSLRPSSLPGERSVTQPGVEALSD